MSGTSSIQDVGSPGSGQGLLLPGYRETAPPALLRGLVTCLWVRVPGGVTEVRVVPDGCVDLVWRRGVGVMLAGPDTAARVDVYGADDVMVGIRFMPGAGGGVLGLALDEVRDARVEAAEVDRAFALDGGLSPHEVLPRLVSALAGRRGDPLVAEAVLRLAREDVSTVARELFVSERQLRRRFQAAVGYGPKTLARVLRFRRIVEAIDDGRSDLAALAFEAGYADQAHLTRETSRLAGLAPTELIRARQAASPAAGSVPLTPDA